MKRCGIAVFYAPLSSEAFVNLQILSDLLPFTICHEQAHEAGFASEQTANYVAFEICQNAAPEMCYSALLEVLLYGMYELHDCDSPLWKRLLLLCLPALILFQAIQQKVYDVLLQVFGQNGIRAYSDVLALIDGETKTA